jgi:hypothetical protein
LEATTTHPNPNSDTAPGTDAFAASGSNSRFAAMAPPPPPMSAAGMVVNRQEALSQYHLAPPTTMATFAPGSADAQQMDAMDAWSLSLQKFAASSLEADFLQADSVRKNNNQPPPPSFTAAAPPPPPPPPGMPTVAEFAPYDVTESATVAVMAPPPGLAPDASQQVVAQAAARLVHEWQHNIIHGEDDDEEEESIAPVPRPTPMTPQNSTCFAAPPQPHHLPPPQHQQRLSSAPTPQPTPVTVKPLRDVAAGGAGAGAMMMRMLPPPVAVPMRGPAWQLPPQPQPQQPPPMMMMMRRNVPPPTPPLTPPRRAVFANPHPAAPPVPTAALASRYMTARDINYAVRAMLRPMLAAETAGNMSDSSSNDEDESKEDAVAQEISVAVVVAIVAVSANSARRCGSRASTATKPTSVWPPWWICGSRRRRRREGHRRPRCNRTCSN